MTYQEIIHGRKKARLPEWPEGVFAKVSPLFDVLRSDGVPVTETEKRSNEWVEL